MHVIKEPVKIDFEDFRIKNASFIFFILILKNGLKDLSIRYYGYQYLTRNSKRPESKKRSQKKILISRLLQF